MASKANSNPAGPQPPQRHCGIHWDVLSVALAIAGFAIALPRLPTAWKLCLIAVAAGMFLFAVGLPQRTSRSAVKAVINFARSDWNARRSGDAMRLLEAVTDELAAQLSALGTRRRGLSSVLRPGAHPAVAEYQWRHRHAVVHAVGVAIEAGAQDEGMIGLAQRPRDIADLHALLAGLRRMTLELA